MEAIRVNEIIAKDGEISITGLPYKKGQCVEIIVFSKVMDINRPSLTVRKFRQAGLIGMWKERDDIVDSSVYARQLREQAQLRRHINDDFA